MASERSVSHSYAYQGPFLGPLYNPWFHLSYAEPILAGRTFNSVQELWESLSHLVPGSLQDRRGEPAAHSRYLPQYSPEEAELLPLVVLLSTADAVQNSLPKKYHSSFHLEIAQIALRKKVDTVAEAYFKKAVAGGSQNPAAWLCYANFLDTCGRKQQCLEVLLEGFSLCPYSHELLDSILLKEIPSRYTQSH